MKLLIHVLSNSDKLMSQWFLGEIYLFIPPDQYHCGNFGFTPEKNWKSWTRNAGTYVFLPLYIFISRYTIFPLVSVNYISLISPIQYCLLQYYFLRIVKFRTERIQRSVRVPRIQWKENAMTASCNTAGRTYCSLLPSFTFVSYFCTGHRH